VRLNTPGAPVTATAGLGLPVGRITVLPNKGDEADEARASDGALQLIPGVIPTQTLTLEPRVSDRDGLFVAFRSEESGRWAEICEELDSVWLYLSEPGTRKVAVSTWLLNTLEAPAEPTQEPYRSRSAPPPAPAAYCGGRWSAGGSRRVTMERALGRNRRSGGGVPRWPPGRHGAGRSSSRTCSLHSCRGCPMGSTLGRASLCGSLFRRRRKRLRAHSSAWRDNNALRLTKSAVARVDAAFAA
jgi:hypothetical protein